METIHKTLEEMFSIRGYSNIEISKETITALKKDGEKICAFKTIITKLNIEKIKNLIQLLIDMEINHGIIVHQDKPTSAVKNFLINSSNTDLKIELFPDIDLQYNPVKHVLVPEHILLDKKESQEFKQKYGTGIQVLLRNDPVARFYGFDRSSIVKIIRKDGIGYRIVR